MSRIDGMKGESAATFLVLLFAGCLGEVNQDETVPAVPTEGAASVLSFARTIRFDLTEIQKPAPLGVTGAGGENCFRVHATDTIEILNGTASLRWTANSPASEELVFMMSSLWPYKVRTYGPQRSPITVDLAELEAANRKSTSRDGLPEYKFDVHASRPGAAVEQPVDLSLSYSYTTNSTMQFHTMTCRR